MYWAEVKEIYENLLRWQSAGHLSAVATVVDTWQSSPRSKGSQLIVNTQMEVVGSVSGGCVESEVIELCQQVIHTQVTQVKVYGIADETAWQVGLSCGGQVTIYIEPVTERLLDVYQTIIEDVEARKYCCLFRPLVGGATQIHHKPVADFEFFKASNTFFNDDFSYAKTNEGYFQLMRPIKRLWIFGAMHTAIYLAEFAKKLGYEVTVIDPRAVFANRQRFPDVRLAVVWPKVFLADHAIDEVTAVVTFFHDPKFDDVILTGAVSSTAFYIGALGGRKTREKRQTRLLQQGLTPHQLDRIDSPIGLPLGGKSAIDIAISVAAKLIAVENQVKGM